MNQRYKIPSASPADYGKWLSQTDWDYFGTFTTGYELTLPSARRAMERFSDRLSEKHGGAKTFWVAEPFDCKEGYHTHALVRLNDRTLFGHEFATENVSGEAVSLKTPSIAFDLLRETWQITSKGGPGKWNRVQLKRYDPLLGAGYYVGKYMMKRRVDYDFRGC